MKEPKEITLDYLKNILESYFGFEIFQKSRKRNVLEARYIFYYCAKTYLKQGCAQLSRYSNQNHATVLHAWKTFNNWYDTNKYFKHTYDHFIRNKGIELELMLREAKHNYASYLANQLITLVNTENIKLKDDDFYKLIELIENQTNNLTIAV